MKDPTQLAQLARAAAQRGDWIQAEQLMSGALQLAPEAAALHLNYGNILKQLGRYDEARTAYEQALYWQAGWADAHYNLGNLAVVRHDPVAAAEHYRATLDANPQHVEAHYNLASILTNQGQFAPAHQHFAKALAINPQHADAQHNLARLYRREGDLAQARAHYTMALQINPEHALAKYSLGTLDLFEGRWETGWQGYESRWPALHKPYPNTPLARWSGEAVSPQSRLLVIGEQGLGDMLQFARFLPQLRAQFAQVTVLVPEVLRQLLQHSFPTVDIVDQLSSHAPYTHHIPYMSLGAALQINEQGLAGVAYLQAEEAACQAWRKSLPAGYKVGLAWQGNPQQVDNRWRSIPFNQLAPLLALPNITWCNLQYGVSAAAPLRDDSSQWRDLADTAAYVKNLDLVVTACTSIVHLAGALGVPTILLSRCDADWRWQAERSDSPWYQSVHIVRQTLIHDWATPIAQVMELIRSDAIISKSAM
ncbi:tetratricopeptide repeat protein [Chitinibacter bivalviorum]|uniref:Tetratricopeptide repeat protein n=1 Tax=Chitinibacter bivalviorum TaxID=2739434 RepID=A0A7H9BL99_9NEIS|nr:tetratricopeptide repeat protein [Chitinibacter bivalviorum]QLG89048.1 tetratricopeptide repeat protein [Chitinibacter bivalviorum]